VYWTRLQAKMITIAKGLKDGIVLAGDGRHDSMGHCAKYGTYSMFCCNAPMIMHFLLVQVKDKFNNIFLQQR